MHGDFSSLIQDRLPPTVSTKMTSSVVLQKLATFNRPINADQVADTFGVKRRSVYHFVRKGSIPHFHIAGKLMFDPGILAAWYEKQ
jgi:Helix-turn-helix domain